VVVAVLVAACSSTNSSTTTTTGSSGTTGTSGSTTGANGRPAPPQSAMSDHTGVTATSIHVANIATLSVVPGLFKGAVVGTQAYFDQVNQQGGVGGRKIVVDSGDDQFQGSVNRQLTQNAVDNDFAIVGAFSLDDSYGGTVLAANPGMPDVSNVLDLTTGKLPNVYSPVPLGGGGEEGPIQYFKHKYPQDLDKAGAMVAGTPASEADWVGEKNVLQKVGFNVVYDPTFPETQTDFTQYVITMKNMGVKIIFNEQMPFNYAGAFIKDLAQQNYHPQVIFGAAAYSSLLVSSSGGPANIDGSLLEQNASLYLGQDASAVPAVATFLHWVNVASPGFHPDLFTLYGWLSAELFTQALRNAGSDPSRGSLLEALSKVTSFNGDNIVTTANPAARTVGNCYLIGEIANGDFQRLDDPPVTGPTNGYRCDYSYVTPPS
jgi:branched-chain amino acid transport system substrate-binding protein